MSRIDLDAAPPLRLEEARWLFIHDGADVCRFIRFVAAGEQIVRELVSNGCSDVIANPLPNTALDALVAAGIRVWHAEPGASARALVDRLQHGALSEFLPAGR